MASATDKTLPPPAFSELSEKQEAFRAFRRNQSKALWAFKKELGLCAEHFCMSEPACGHTLCDKHMQRKRK